MHHDVGAVAKSPLRQPRSGLAARTLSEKQFRGTRACGLRPRQLPEQALRGLVAETYVAVGDAFIERPVEEARVTDVLARDTAAFEQGKSQLPVAVPRGTCRALPQPRHQALLVAAQEVGRAAAADDEQTAEPGLALQQGLRPGSGGDHIHRFAEALMKVAQQDRQQHHVAECAKAHHQWRLICTAPAIIQ